MDLQSVIAMAGKMFGSSSNSTASMDIAGDGGGDPNKDSISLKDSAGIKKGNYSKTKIQGLIKAAKAVGVKPHQLLALAWQESDLGGDVKNQPVDDPNVIHGRGKGRASGSIGQIKDFSEGQYKEMSELADKTGINSGYLKTAIAFRDKLKYAKQLGFNDEAMQLQAYNGYGKLTPPKDAKGNVVPTKYYGQLVGAEGLDMRQNPLYGKRLLSLAGDLSKNKDINDLINEKSDLPIPTATSVAAKK